MLDWCMRFFREAIGYYVMQDTPDLHTYVVNHIRHNGLPSSVHQCSGGTLPMQCCHGRCIHMVVGFFPYAIVQCCLFLCRGWSRSYWTHHEIWEDVGGSGALGISSYAIRPLHLLSNVCVLVCLGRVWLCAFCES